MLKTVEVEPPPILLDAIQKAMENPDCGIVSELDMVKNWFLVILSIFRADLPMKKFAGVIVPDVTVASYVPVMAFRMVLFITSSVSNL
jgi:hypothetical protein